MRLDASSAAVMRKASRGPAEIALRAARSLRMAPVSNVAGILTAGAGPAPMPTGLGCMCGQTCHCHSTGLGSLGAAGSAVPAKWQVDPTALRQLIATVSKAAPAPVAVAPTTPTVAPANLAARVAALRAGSGRLMGFGSLGFSPTTGTVVSKVAGGAASTAATAAATTYGAGTILASSSVAGPIGLAAGIVIALAVSLFTKQYFNVGQSNQLCQQLEALFQKYTALQGYVAGRALGWQTMNQIMHAAVGAGLFPGNNMHLAFHEGTLQCAGHGDWVDAFTGYTAQGTPGAACGAHNCMADALRQFNHANVPPGTPDAVYFVDSILLPMNAPGKAAIPWVYNGAQQSANVHQLLYDLADAYLAQFASGTVPYVEYPQSQVGTPTPGALPAPTQLVPAQTAATISSQNMAPTTQVSAAYPSGGGGGFAPALPQDQLQPTGGQLPPGYTGAATTGVTLASNPLFLYLGGGLLLAAVFFGARDGKRHHS